MLSLKSETAELNYNQEKVFNFLVNLNNLEQLLPQKIVSEWEATETQCSFKVKGMGTIGFKHESLEGPNKINLASISDKPFPFKLIIHVNENGENAAAHLTVDADVNMFMKMMVEKPLTDFFNSIANRLRSAEIS